MLLLRGLELRTFVHRCRYLVLDAEPIVLLGYDAIIRCVWLEPFAPITQTMLAVHPLQLRINKDPCSMVIIGFNHVMTPF